DPADYVPPAMFDEWSAKDPLDIAARQLTEAGFATEEEIAVIREEARQQAIAARKKSLSDPMPVPDREEERVYAGQ
ncbi:MAG TPA: thiamine pyrophosphate-dependent enzyme, partial [Actinoplanes sp.]